MQLSDYEMNIRGDVKNGHIRFIIQVESFSLQSQYHKVKKVNLFYGTLRNGARMMDYMSEKHLKVSGLYNVEPNRIIEYAYVAKSQSLTRMRLTSP